ncbi:MAG: hypothetical protein GPJ09_11720 [Microcystis aeruginosa SX13-01]|nr:hypothetical protein [Microcystis aeruginosa SX13-01]NCR68279.1 hypothetical protein [Microcystis aeruginosa LL11-07]
MSNYPILAKNNSRLTAAGCFLGSGVWGVGCGVWGVGRTKMPFVFCLLTPEI